MSIKKQSTKQTSLELPETSHGAKKESDETGLLGGIRARSSSSIPTNLFHRNKMLIKSKSAPASILNIQDGKKDDVDRRFGLDPITFPISEKYNSCCGSCQRLCCNPLVDTDDLILRQEREQLLLHLHEEEVQSSCDKHVEYVVECSMGICFKKPKSCCSYCESCWKHPVSVWGYRVWQVVILLVIVMLFVPRLTRRLLCEESSTLNLGHFHCDAVQTCLRESNYTKSSDGYAGMINTMKALSVPVCETIHESITQTISESDCISINGTYHLLPPNFVVQGMPGINGTNLNNEVSFLRWHALTKSTSVLLLRFLVNSFYIILLPVIFLVFGMHSSQKDDPTEIMFPSLLETKDVREVVEINVDIGNKKLIYSQKFHFVRPKKFVLQSSLWSMAIIYLIFWVGIVVGNNYEFGDMLMYLLAAFILGPLGSIILIGLFVQIHNATTLANILVQLCSVEKVSPEERQAQFEQWKDYYKTALGALHIWSWRVSPIIFVILLTNALFVICELVTTIFIYATINSEPDLADSKRMEMFLKLGSGNMQLTVIFTLILLICTGAIAMVSVRYKRLRLLVAILRLPKHELQDFEILQRQHAAVTIFDIPITANTVTTILHLLFVQTALVALTSAGS